MNEKEKTHLDKATIEAQSILNDPMKTKRILEKVINKTNNKEGIFDSIWDDLNSLVRLLKAWRTGDYQNVSRKSLLLTVGAFLYLINPLDIIPDFTPVLGLMDDVTIIGFVINSIRGEISKFQEWESSLPVVDITEYEEV